jgi:hypothetical protein
LRVALALACLLVACGDAREVHILGGACPFGAEHTLSTLDGPVLDGIAVTAHGDGAYVAWSERSGLFGLALDRSGAPSGERERIGPSCTGGLDAIDDGRVIVACSIQGDVERGDRGAVVVYARDARWTVIDRREGVGEGSGVSLARGASVVVGWQQASGASSAAWIATIGDASDPLRLSRAGFRATAPVMSFEGETRLALWGELWIDDRGDATGRMTLQVGNRAPHPVSTLAYELPLPTLTPDVHGGAILAFRDRRPARTRPALQLARVTADTRELAVSTGAPANAAGSGVAVACQGSVMVVAPRTHSRTERLVSVRRHADSLAGLGPEQQLYEHGSTFEWADALCLGDRTLIVFGSRSSPLSPVGTVRSVTVDCTAPQQE